MHATLAGVLVRGCFLMLLVSVCEKLYFPFCFPSGSDDKESVCNATDLGSIPGLGRSPEDGTATQSLFLPGESPRIEEPGGLKSMGSQRVGHD